MVKKLILNESNISLNPQTVWSEIVNKCKRKGNDCCYDLADDDRYHWVMVFTYEDSFDNNGYIYGQIGKYPLTQSRNADFVYGVAICNINDLKFLIQQWEKAEQKEKGLDKLSVLWNI